MSFSHETQQKINQFAKEQSQHYLDAAEMTYLEKLRWKTGQTKYKVGQKMARFRGSSEKGREAQNDMMLYMSDYMSDLISQGMTEQDAFERARKELEHASGSEQAAGLGDRYREYFENRDPARDEAMGLFYAGFGSLGLIGGGLVGFLTSGGREAFLSGGWVDTLIGLAVGMLLGGTLGMFSHAIIALGKRK